MIALFNLGRRAVLKLFLLLSSPMTQIPRECAPDKSRTGPASGWCSHGETALTPPKAADLQQSHCKELNPWLPSRA